MRTKAFLSASRITALMLACVISIGFVACNKDDDGDNGTVNSYEKKIIGTWVYEKRSYSFNSDGSGMYDSGGDVGGSFKYNLDGCTVYLRIVYVNSKYGSVWRDEISGWYNPDDDTFRIYGNKYVRKK